MFDKTKKFVKEHKTELIVGTVCIGTTLVLGYKFKKMPSDMINSNNDKTEKAIEAVKRSIEYNKANQLDETIRLDNMYDIANRSLNREGERIKFEIEELKNFISNLDPTKNINIFHRIPEKEAMINTLETQLKEIQFDQDKINEIMDEIWN